MQKTVPKQMSTLFVYYRPSEIQFEKHLQKRPFVVWKKPLFWRGFCLWLGGRGIFFSFFFLISRSVSATSQKIARKEWFSDARMGFVFEN